MHQNSMAITAWFVRERLAGRGRLRVLDVGSMDVNGTTRQLYEDAGHEYVGLDIAPGRNVDVVAAGPYSWPVADGGFSVLSSNNCVEHVEDPFAWFREADRVLEPGGLACIVTPWMIHEHRHPVDCWRIMPDGYRALARTVGWSVIECGLINMDAALVARK